MAAIISKYTQLNDRNIFRPYKASELNKREKKEVLNLITMVKEKRDGKIKGRAFADGRKQRRYIRKDEVSPPIVQLESLMLSMLIDAHEQ